MQAHLRPSISQDKSCQSTQCEHMWPVKPVMTQSSHMQSVKPAIPQASHIWPVKVMGQSNHKKSQVKLAMAQSCHIKPMSNATRKQIDVQPEVVRNSNKHAVLPTHAPHVGQHVMFQDSKSKHGYPAVSESLCPESRSYKITTTTFNQCVPPSMAQSTHMWPVKNENKKKSEVNTKSQVQTSKSKRDTSPKLSLFFKYCAFILYSMDVYSVTVYVHDHPMELVNT